MYSTQYIRLVQICIQPIRPASAAAGCNACGRATFVEDAQGQDTIALACDAVRAVQAHDETLWKALFFKLTFFDVGTTFFLQKSGKVLLSNPEPARFFPLAAAPLLVLSALATPVAELPSAGEKRVRGRFDVSAPQASFETAPAPEAKQKHRRRGDAETEQRSSTSPAARIPGKIPPQRRIPAVGIPPLPLSPQCAATRRSSSSGRRWRRRNGHVLLHRLPAHHRRLEAECRQAERRHRLQAKSDLDEGSSMRRAYRPRPRTPERVATYKLPGLPAPEAQRAYKLLGTHRVFFHDAIPAMHDVQLHAQCQLWQNGSYRESTAVPRSALPPGFCNAHHPGRFFAFEHPVRATSWQRRSVKALLEALQVQVVSFDQCRVNLRSPSGKPIQKRTTLMTNSSAIVQLFKLQCQCTEPHQKIEGQDQGIKLSTWCQVYTAEFVDVIAARLEWEEAQRG